MGMTGDNALRREALKKARSAEYVDRVALTMAAFDQDSMTAEGAKTIGGARHVVLVVDCASREGFGFGDVGRQQKGVRE